MTYLTPINHIRALITSIKLAYSKKSYLHELGWRKSVVSKQPLDRSGQPIPWMNYTVITLLRERLDTSLRLYEYGSGYSTTFYATLVKEVVSLEYDAQWHATVNRMKRDNVQIRFQTNDIDGSYCRSILAEDGQFDVIVIDGRDRVNCAIQCLHKVSDRGVILLDDSDRDRYRDAFVHVSNHGYRQLTLRGIKPMSYKPHQTTIFYKDNNCLNL